MKRFPGVLLNRLMSAATRQVYAECLGLGANVDLNYPYYGIWQAVLPLQVGRTGTGCLLKTKPRNTSKTLAYIVQFQAVQALPR